MAERPPRALVPARDRPHVLDDPNHFRLQASAGDRLDAFALAEEALELGWLVRLSLGVLLARTCHAGGTLRVRPCDSAYYSGAALASG